MSRGCGLLLGVELVADRASRAPAPEAAEAVLYDCLANGLSFKVSLGNVLTLSPPLVVTDGEMDLALGVLEDAIGRAAPRGTAWAPRLPTRAGVYG